MTATGVHFCSDRCRAHGGPCRQCLAERAAIDDERLQPIVKPVFEERGFDNRPFRKVGGRRG